MAGDDGEFDRAADVAEGSPRLDSFDAVPGALLGDLHELAALGVQEELAEADFQGRPRALSNLLGSR